MKSWLKLGAAAGVTALVWSMPAAAQGAHSLKEHLTGGSSNVHVLGHLPLGNWSQVMDLEIEQELSRPYAFVARSDFLPLCTQPHQRGCFSEQAHSTPSKGVDIIGIKDPSKPTIMYSWRIPDQDVHRPTGGMDNKYFKLKGRYYDVQSLQFGQGGPDTDIGAVVLDITGLPDTSKVKELGLIRASDTPGGFHNMFMYKHSDGRALLFTTTSGAHANIYDMEKFLAKDPKQGLIGEVPVPETQGMLRASYHDMYVGYDVANHRDVFYGAGSGGYYVFDVSKADSPTLLTSITGVAGVTYGHTFTPDPTGRYAVSETEYQYTPLRIFDLKPGLDGQVKTISRPIGAWLNAWDSNVHNHEVRWPYVFVSGYMDGLQVFNMMDPTNPYTVGYYYTCDCPLPAGDWGQGLGGGMDGAFGVDVRNADGLIVISDRRTGFWSFKMDGFDGWNGHQWGMPNVSSVQDWDNGPEGAPKTKVS